MRAYMKAIVAALAAGIAYAATVADNGITSVEWLQITGATLAAFNLVYWTPNRSEIKESLTSLP